MAEGNGDVSKDSTEHTFTNDYSKLITYGLDAKVAGKLDEIYQTGKLAHVDLDDRALDALKEFPVDGALKVLGQFLESNLEHVSNKSAYLCGVMKTYRQRSRVSTSPAAPAPPVKGPDEEKIKAILERTGYALDVTTGQRKYGGPPPNWTGPAPVPGCEVFCGKIPKDLYEDELIPLFEQCGEIWDLRLMMDPMTGQNRGYAFVTFTDREAANRAVDKLDKHEVRPGKALKVNISVPNLRLFVGNIPKSKGKEEILEEFSKLAAGLTEVIIYSAPDDKKKNRGFCFLEYETHKAASLAKRRFSTGRVKVWGCDIIVDWADPQEEPDPEVMSKVKVLYVRNLTQECTEERLKSVFDAYGEVGRVKKIKDYAFVHFERREDAVRALAETNGRDVAGAQIEVSLAKPPSDKKKKEDVLRARERRMMQMMQGRATSSPSHAGLLGPAGLPIRGGTRSGGIRGLSRSDYDYEYDYGDYRSGYADYEDYCDPYYDSLSYTRGIPYRTRKITLVGAGGVEGHGQQQVAAAAAVGGRLGRGPVGVRPVPLPGLCPATSAAPRGPPLGLHRARPSLQGKHTLDVCQVREGALIQRQYETNHSPPLQHTCCWPTPPLMHSPCYAHDHFNYIKLLAWG